MGQNYLNGLTIGIAVIVLFRTFHASPIAEDLLVEFKCFDDSECTNFKNDSMKVRCENTECQCTLLATQQPTDCILKDSKVTNIISGPCPCTQPHSVCHKKQRICYCVEDFIPSKDKRRCLPRISKKGESCELNSQCRVTDEFSICHNKTCTCQENYANINGTCVYIAQRIACHTNEMCKNRDSHLICAVAENLCICDAGFVLGEPKNDTNTTCLPTLQYQENCLSDYQCQNSLGLGWGAECNSLGICDCNNKHFARKFHTADSIDTTTKCEPLIVAGQYCRNEEDCYQHNLADSEQSMHCSYAECNCKYGSWDGKRITCNSRSEASRFLKPNNLYLLFFLYFFL